MVILCSRMSDGAYLIALFCDGISSIAYVRLAHVGVQVRPVARAACTNGLTLKPRVSGYTSSFGMAVSAPM